LGYCADDEDLVWLKGFNLKAEGSSGGDGASGSGSGSIAQSPLRESRSGENAMFPPGRPSRGKGKEREKDGPAPPVYISEDTFEYVMGVLEKNAEDSVPTLHTVGRPVDSHYGITDAHLEPRLDALFRFC
jgi:enhancer of polycomb-like protein